jgi:hypothetical protein
MSTVTPEELLKQWKLEQMPLEMAMGHVLQNLVKQQTMLNTLELALAQFRAQFGSERTLTNISPTTKTKKRSH